MAISSEPPRAHTAPGARTPSPLIELSRLGLAGLRIFAKVEWCGATGSIKDRIAEPMIEAAMREGRLRRGMTIVEASSGNTAAALGAAAAPRGLSVLALIPSGIAPAKLARLAAYGCETWDCSGFPDGNNPEVRREIARDMAEAEPDRYCTLDQFANAANVQAHVLGTGREAGEQLAAAGIERLDLYCAGAGTGGSLTGVTRALRASAVGAQTRVVLADPAGSALASMVRGQTYVDAGGVSAPDGIGHKTWPDNLDRSCLADAIEVTRAEALAALARLRDTHGLLAGPCVGYALAALTKLSGSRGEGEPLTALVLISDRGEPYLADPAYRAALAGQAEPEIVVPSRHSRERWLTPKSAHLPIA